MSDKQCNKRSDASLAAAKHWTSIKRQKEINASDRGNTSESGETRIEIVNSSKEQEIIVISSDDEEIDIPRNRNSDENKNLKRSQIRLLYNPSYSLHGDRSDAEVNRDTLLLPDLVGSKSLIETYQFNFSIDLDFFLMHLHPEISKKRKKITFITGSSLLDGMLVDDITFIKSKFNINELIADLPTRFGTHHTKMMINFYEDETCEIIIMTCNLQKIDFGGLTQMCWKSERLHKTNAKTTSIRGARFQKDLKNYLFRYKKKELNLLAKSLDYYDFQAVDVELVASTPGFFDMAELSDESEIYGYGKLYQVLQRNNLLLDNSGGDKIFNILAQVSSISYPFAIEKLNVASVFSHILCPLVFSGQNNSSFDLLEPGAALFKKHQAIHNYQPHILYPSADDVANSNVGFASGQAIHFKYTTTPTHRNQYEQNIKPYLYKWRSRSNSDQTGRENVPPHVKLYMCDNGDNWSTLRWVLMGSHNLSKQAWGAKQETKFNSKDLRKYKVSSYELGVLVPGYPHEHDGGFALTPVYGSDAYTDSQKKGNTPLRMPFTLPPAKYRINDKPWSALVNYGNSLKDKFGQCYHGLDS